MFCLCEILKFLCFKWDEISFLYAMILILHNHILSEPLISVKPSFCRESQRLSTIAAFPLRLFQVYKILRRTSNSVVEPQFSCLLKDSITTEGIFREYANWVQLLRKYGSSRNICRMDGILTADIVQKPMMTLYCHKLTNANRIAKGEIILIVILSFCNLQLHSWHSKQKAIHEFIHRMYCK